MNEGGVDLCAELLDIAGQIEKDISSTIQLIAIEDIKVALSSIQTNKAYGLKQVGIVDIESPSYTKHIAAGLFLGLFIGLLWAFSLKITRQLRGA